MSTPPSQPPTPNPVHAVLNGVWSGVEHAVVHQPWVAVLIGLFVACGVVQKARRLIHDGPRDPVRRFSRSDKALLLAWAANRCEHHSLFGRCTSTERLEADHIHPHSRGGWTHVSNGQILCKRHNQAKRANIPWERSLRKISERRAAYYPAHIDRTIVRRQPRQPKKSSV